MCLISIQRALLITEIETPPLDSLGTLGLGLKNLGSAFSFLLATLLVLRIGSMKFMVVHVGSH